MDSDLRMTALAAYTKGSPVLSLEKALHKNKIVNAKQ
jgi:hypothetical protein